MWDVATVPPRFVVRMRIEREEVLFCSIKFESMAHKYQFFDKWAGHILAQPEVRRIQQYVGFKSDRSGEADDNRQEASQFRVSYVEMEC